MEIGMSVIFQLMSVLAEHDGNFDKPLLALMWLAGMTLGQDISYHRAPMSLEIVAVACCSYDSAVCTR